MCENFFKKIFIPTHTIFLFNLAGISCIRIRTEHLFRFFMEKNSEDGITVELKSKGATIA